MNKPTTDQFLTSTLSKIRSTAIREWISSSQNAPIVRDSVEQYIQIASNPDAKYFANMLVAIAKDAGL